MITKLKGFAADAEIMGEIHEVRFEGESLIIDDLELHEATEILRRLSDKALVATELPQETEPVQGAGAPAVENPRTEPPKPPPEAPKQSAPPPAPPAPPVATQPPPAVASPPVVTTPSQDGVPEEIVNAQRLRDVVDYFTQKAGMKTVEEVIAAIEKYKGASPTIQRATDIQNRVKRIMTGTPA